MSRIKLLVHLSKDHECAPLALTMLMAWRACEEGRDAWKLCPKGITYDTQQAELTELCKDARFAKVGVDIQREPLRRVERAFQALFRRVQAGKKPGYSPIGVPRPLRFFRLAQAKTEG